MRFFYQANRLSSLLKSSKAITYFHTIGHPLAILDATRVILLASDKLQSTQFVHSSTRREVVSYSAYGFTMNTCAALLGFTGERLHRCIGGYLLGNGYRAYSPVLMRFNSPDRSSPFLKGGINAYLYVSADPINYADPSGQVKTQLFVGAGQRLAKDALLFRSKDKQGMKTLSLDAHGDGAHIFIDDQPYAPGQLIKYLQSQKVELSSYNKVCLYACHTANEINGRPSYAKQFADLSQVPTTGHKGTVKTMVLESPPSNLPVGLMRIEHRVFMEEPNAVTGATTPFNYSPKTFQPSTSQTAIRQGQHFLR